MRARRWSATVAAAALLLVTPACMGSKMATASDPATPSPTRSVGSTTPSEGTFLGLDGRYYPEAPKVVPGAPGTDQLYFGTDFDDACFRKREFDSGLRALADLRRMIAKSGRKVVWGVAPNKSSVLTAQLPSTLPHGECDRVGLQHQSDKIDSFRGAGYFHVRTQLAAGAPGTWWRTDNHWNTVGGAIFAKALARKLDPRLAQRQRYDDDTVEQVGYLNYIQGVSTTETAPAKVPTDFATVRTTLSRKVDIYTARVRWTTTPARKTWPGRTLIVGDSFTSAALSVLKPLFNKGEFSWIGLYDYATLARDIARADTVVLMRVQVSVSDAARFIAALKPYLEQALADAPRR